ncbi:MAG TPA: hypothetical protein VFF43_02300 [Caldimonas sp.]|jgi:hypothetical protein|nr:hypothetical protein [Caldimonas sp.]
MAAQSTEPLHARLEALIALARLLERVEASTRAVGPAQYRSLVRQIESLLSAPLPGPALRAILDAHPATAVIWENLHYATSGLARSPLDTSVATERLATELLRRVARAASRG